MIRYVVVLAMVFAAMQNSYAQSNTRVISGLVTRNDQSTPLEGVLVAIKGTDKTSGSQPDGVYYIEVGPKDSVLVFSFSDFKTQEVKLSTTANQYNIVLQKGSNTTPAVAAFSPIGNWRGVFQLKQGQEIPFNFSIEKGRGVETKLYFLNAEEKFEGGIVKQTGDSVFIPIDQFENELAFKIDGAALNGVLRRQDGKGTPLPIKAEAGPRYRFKETGTQPGGDISGTYDITFTSAKGKEEKAVGLFKQEGSKLTGTFLRITGDSRFLEGIVEGNNFYLSSFIGSGPVYYHGTFSKDGKLTGDITSPWGGQTFTGSANEDAALPDPYTLTYLKDGYKTFDFSFPDVNGNKVSLQDAKYKNKVVIVTITGSWCPNCIDEASFLAPWYKQNKARGVEIVSIHYERQTDTAFVRKALSHFRERFGIQYDQVLGGIADKQVVATSLPSLNTFLSFPTTIFIDKKGNVAKIHTGYSGPATGKYYQAFLKEFNDEIDLLAKK